VQGFELEGRHSAAYFTFNVPAGTISVALCVRRLYSNAPAEINFHATRNILLGTNGADKATGLPLFQNVKPLLSKVFQSGSNQSLLTDTEMTSPLVRPTRLL
jgi:hypothetical protein